MNTNDRAKNTLLNRFKELLSNGSNTSQVIGKENLINILEHSTKYETADSVICNLIKLVLKDRATRLGALDITDERYCIQQAILSAEIAILSILVDVCCISESICDLLKSLLQRESRRLSELDPSDSNYCIRQATLSTIIILLSALIDVFCCL